MRKPKGREGRLRAGEKSAATNTYDESESRRGGTTARRDQRESKAQGAKERHRGETCHKGARRHGAKGELRVKSSTNCELNSAANKND